MRRLRAPDQHPEPVLGLGHVRHGQCGQLAAPESAGEADEQQRPIAQPAYWSKKSISLKTRNNWQAAFEGATPALRDDSSVM
jgi:hypothetical protein